MTTARQVAMQWAAAVLYHDDATNIQVALGEQVRGRRAIFESSTAYFWAFPDNDTRVENILEDGEWAIVERNGGTMHGELAGHAPTARSVTLRG